MREPRPDAPARMLLASLGMKHLALFALLLGGCADTFLPASEPLCQERLLPAPEGSDYLVARQNYIGLAGDYGAVETIHRDGRVTFTARTGEALETVPSLGPDQLAPLLEALAALDGEEAEGCYPAGGSSLTRTDSGCDIKLVVARENEDLRFAGCQLPAGLDAVSRAAITYTTAARHASRE
ncbi:MAG TPA: hypothetical protein DEF51_08705 [Myxococcales bacterium]|nr:hypothetical protein [Myxococcales bacterium]